MGKSQKTMFYVGGCSGSASPEISRIEFGNLTTAFGILFGDTGIFIDNGTGISKVASFLLNEGVKQVYGTQTHYHHDHKQGIQQNRLLFMNGLIERIYSPKFKEGGKSFQGMMDEAFTPDTWPIAPGGLTMHEFIPGEDLDVPLALRTIRQNHPGDPGGSVGYRFTTPAGDIVVSTDSEPMQVIKEKGKEDRVIDCTKEMADFVSGAKLLYIDVQYRDGEYEGELSICGNAKIPRAGWGHGTPSMLLSILSKCAVVPKMILVGHHDDKRTDEDLYVFEQEIKELLAPFNTTVRFAREGEAIEV